MLSTNCMSTCSASFMLHADDSSVFDTSLSQEYAIAAASFGLSEAQLQALAGSAADYTFLNAEARAQLKQRILGD
jgi:adenosine deaminase